MVLVLALVYSDQRLKPYFQGRLIKVCTEYPLWKVLANAQESRRLAERASYLSAYNIVFERRVAEKGQVLASLISMTRKTKEHKDTNWFNREVTEMQTYGWHTQMAHTTRMDQVLDA